MNESGFTLVELLVVIAIIGILGMLGVTSYRIYRASAVYAVVGSTFDASRKAIEAGLNDIDNPPGAVNVSQNVKGAIVSAAGRALMPGMILPNNVKLQVTYDPACVTAACVAQFVQVNHCLGEEYLQWSRFGDGIDVLLSHIAGSGCL